MVLTKTNTGQGGHCRRRPTGKSRTTECYNIYRRNYEKFGNLRKIIEKSLRHQSNSNGNIINLTKYSVTKTEYELLNKYFKKYTIKTN